MGGTSGIKLSLSTVFRLAASGTTVCLLKPEISPSALGTKVSPRPFPQTPFALLLESLVISVREHRDAGLTFWCLLGEPEVLRLAAFSLRRGGAP